MPACSLADLQRNHLLSLLSPESQQRVLPLLTLVTVPVGHYVSRANQPSSGHLFVSYMLVAPQATVNRAMKRLSEANLITYIYDKIHIVNREQLEKASCECYGAIKREYDRILGTCQFT